MTTAAGLSGDSQLVNDVGVGEAIIDYAAGGGGVDGEVGIAEALGQ